MGNSQATPMTRAELRKARQSGGAVISEELIEEITLKVWSQFGETQRDHPDLDHWQVVYRINLDIEGTINEDICKEISKRVVNEYIDEDYPYELESVELCHDDDGYYVVCVFQEEGSDDVDDTISFDSEVSTLPHPIELELDPETDPDPEIELELHSELDFDLDPDQGIVTPY